jgi:cytochrome P450
MHLTNSADLSAQQPASAALRATWAEAWAFPGLLAKIVRNLIESWPASVYSEGLTEARFLGRRTVYVCDPVLIRQLLVDEADGLEREDFMMRALSPALGQGVLTSDGARWRAQRRTVAPMFRHDRIACFVPAMESAVAATRLRWLAGDGRIDVLDEMMRTTFEIIGATMMPDEPGLDVEAFGRDLTAYLDRVSWKIALAMLGAPRFTPHPGCLRAARAARSLRAAVAGTIANRRRSGRDGDDLLGLMLAARDPEGSAAMSDESLVDNLLTFVAAGHETTALAMAWTFRLLAEHPAVEARVLDEIAAAGPGAAPEALPYARQVVMEAMRLYPPAPLIVRRTLRPIRLGAVTIPAGRSIHVPVYAVHRHRALWTSPETFDPDRFAAANPARDKYSYLPFGAGPRVCVGMSFALTECVTILAGLLPAFRFEAGPEPRPEARFKVTLRPHGGLALRVVPRRGADPAW